MSNDMGFLLFVFFIVVFILLLTGGSIIKAIKKARFKAKRDAINKEHQYRSETGRQQRQYHYTAQTAQQQTGPRQQQEQPQPEPEPRAQQEEQPQEEPVEVHTKTATGETIIDRRAGRESKKIYDDSDGEYVEFSES